MSMKTVSWDKMVKLEKEKPCPVCNGFGVIGRIVKGGLQSVKRCVHCFGTGREFL